MIKVSPSILSADFVNLERDIRALSSAGADPPSVPVADSGVSFIAGGVKIGGFLSMQVASSCIAWYHAARARFISRAD